MNTTNMAIIVVLALAVVGILLGVYFSRRARSRQLRDSFGPEYDRTVKALGDEKKAQTELEERQKHVQALDIQPLSASESKRYLSDWTAVQAKFVDEPGQAVLDADRLIMEVMNLRHYPIADFEERAANISVNYPNLVNNYRAAHAIALRHEQHQATTEDLRQSMIYYRSLFEELLETEPVPA